MPTAPRRSTAVLAALAAVVALTLGACDPGPTATPGSRTSVGPASGVGQAVLLSAVHTVSPGVRVFSRAAGDRTSAPWLVYVHGGSWLSGRGDSDRFGAWAAHEFRRGYQVFSLDYRLSRTARWPAQRADVAAAVDWILTRSAVFGLDPARGAIVGESAGGHLAAVEAGRGRFAAAVDLAGVADPVGTLTAAYAPLGAAARQLVGCDPAVCPTTWRSTEAAAYIGVRTPPTLVVHSLDDPIVPSSMSRAYAAALRAAGKDVTLDVIPGREHGLMLLPAVLRRLDVFLDVHTRG